MYSIVFWFLSLSFASNPSHFNAATHKFPVHHSPKGRVNWECLGKSMLRKVDGGSKRRNMKNESEPEKHQIKT